jgi:DNA-binding MarR family transcriptional regulator
MAMSLLFLSPLHRANRQIGVYFEGHVREMGVSPQEGHLLSYLRSYAPCPVSELLRVFGFKPSTMTSLLDRLENRRLVRREVNPEDRRSLLVGLTAKGRIVYHRVQRVVEALESSLRREVTKRELDGFQAVIAAVDRVTGVTLRERSGP